ncbi:uncharacterized protein LOC124275715 [Haliotis rubra]|uniref:uncharacterized protein LOC124275715 n=1 Tax=Haliotis rubra TaxID=36100 RepID=UPI001EE6248F|nr:uncharacterized protein LOC124275715 [Haliotis rubra]
MTELEDKALLTSPIAPICWYREADDTFVVLKPNDNPEHLLNHLNSQHPRMQFTMEEESDNKLPFLDVLVKKEDNKLSTTVYRKPTHTDQYRHFTSNHALEVKKGIISTLTRRAKNICSTTEALETELNHLRHVFVPYNQYPQKLVNNVITITLKPRDKPPRRQSAPFVISIPYVPAVSHQIRRLLQQQAGIDVLFQKGKSIQNLLQATGKIWPPLGPPVALAYHGLTLNRFPSQTTPFPTPKLHIRGRISPRISSNPFLHKYKKLSYQ